MVVKKLYPFINSLEVKSAGSTTTTWVNRDLKDLKVTQPATILVAADTFFITSIDDKEGKQNHNSAYDRVLKNFEDCVQALLPYFSEIRFVSTGHEYDETASKQQTVVTSNDSTTTADAPAAPAAPATQDTTSTSTTTTAATSPATDSTTATTTTTTDAPNRREATSEKARFMNGERDAITRYRFRCIEPFILKRIEQINGENPNVKVSMEQAVTKSREEVMMMANQYIANKKDSTVYVLADAEYIFFHSDQQPSKNDGELVVVCLDKKSKKYKYFKRSEFLRVLLGSDDIDTQLLPAIACMLLDLENEFKNDAQVDKCQQCKYDANGCAEFKRGDNVYTTKQHHALICPNKVADIVKQVLEKGVEATNTASKKYRCFSLKTVEERHKQFSGEQLDKIKRYAFPDALFEQTPMEEMVTEAILDDIATGKLTVRQAALKCTLQEARYNGFAEAANVIVDPRLDGKRRKILRKDFDFVACYRYHLYNLWVHLQSKGVEVTLTKDDLLNFIFSDSRSELAPPVTVSAVAKKEAAKKAAAKNDAKSKFQFLSMDDEDDD
ncbi:hypothetical protein SAMD00019534_112200 [Acytostelium subglobosum LB1]|uniref:hypothetical protein n=1 Tax=Acytostelium subglobosum LB1 TaxID=1410327 RepID=UPI000644D7AC|nr:hypothetical protein SAMD00019534_112200 [Acytostelium subglobosum LB1]GAM28044.1 hypothetical protein SAMD00019534_112200 [Acytostelium subglobosum LB1]|eukprot:XP_012749003.1 hypothetical protein SAMD00019534_112200 [Acytostelium subglobosum LB1]